MEQSLSSSKYCEFAPPARLAHSVVCFWTQTVGPGAQHDRHVLPDCCVDIVVTNGKPSVIGPWTKPFVASLPAGTRIVAVRLQPGLAAAAGIPAPELLNGSATAGELWGSSIERQFQRVEEASGTVAQFAVLEQLIVGHQIARAPVDDATQAAIRQLAADPSLRMDALSSNLGLSRRQLQRKFVAAVGYGPKLFQSVLRFQRILKLTHLVGVQGKLAGFAAEAGYTDQSHMNREVQRFSGKTPKALLGHAGCALGHSSLLREAATPQI
jgi:AraC-like DNA-binding protein